MISPAELVFCAAGAMRRYVTAPAKCSRAAATDSPLATWTAPPLKDFEPPMSTRLTHLPSYPNHSTPTQSGPSKTDHDRRRHASRHSSMLPTSNTSTLEPWISAASFT